MSEARDSQSSKGFSKPFGSDEQTPPEQVFAPEQATSVGRVLPATIGQARLTGPGRRSEITATAQGGHVIRAIKPTGPTRDIAVLATLRTAALRESMGSRPDRFWKPVRSTISITPDDLRVKLRKGKTANLILFIVDASGSMGARKRMMAVKGAVLSLLLDAYQKRDRVGLIAFRGQRADLLVPPTNSVDVAERHLRRLPTGGRTPLIAALNTTGQLLHQYTQRASALTPLVVLITDGKNNVGTPSHLQQTAQQFAAQQITTLLLDSEQGFVKLGTARNLARWLNADYRLLDHLGTEEIVGVVRGMNRMR